MKNSILTRIGLLTITGSALMASCSPLTEEPIKLQEATEVFSADVNPADVNARKKSGVERNYSENFTNQLMQIDEDGNPTKGFPSYFPGIGEGNSSHMGKALTFVNQFASINENSLSSVGAPVTQFYEDELAQIGITNIPDEVSSITTDGKGNSVWFKNIENVVTPVSEEKSDFVAKVEIIGGTGKFEDATGSATVVGSFNPQSLIGMSSIKGRIIY